MRDRDIENIQSALLAVVIGLVVALLLANWSVCEQDDTACLVAISTAVAK